MIQPFLLLAACLLVGAGAFATPVDDAALAHIKAQIETQYEDIDRQMLRQAYDTRSRVTRRDEAPRLELTTFRPDRPAGEKERLEQVNGEAPDRSDQRRFNRRPQPDERDDQPIRLTVDYSTLQLVSDHDEVLRFRFQPQLLLDGEISEHSSLFRGELTWDRSEERLAQVDMALTDAFSYRFFNVEGFTVTETFRRLDDRVLRATYSHEIELRNRLLDLSNAAEMEFLYPEDDLLQHSGGNW